MFSPEGAAMIGEGFLILLIGVGTVFSFFIILNIVMKLTEIAITALNKRFPEINQQPERKIVKIEPETDALIALAIASAKQFSK
jgi:Na+-transporting methylmalonyl-CoA/oxaloacetate decarboxylase gamma subunit